MTTILGWFLVGVPLVMGALLIAVGRQLPKTIQDQLTIGITGLSLGCLSLSFFLIGMKITILPEWWPGIGDLYLKFDPVGLAAAFWTTASGLMFYVLNLKHSSPKHWLQAGLFLFVFTTANIAFLAGNFLLRYVALEIAALAIAVIVLLETGSRNSKFLYLGFRLADVGLLAAILLLNASGASLDIAKALTQALHLPPITLLWISAGFLLAVWVKIGIWPLLIWQKAAAATESNLTKAWFLSTVMPNLGMYLLYRTAPLITQLASMQSAVALTAAASAVFALLFELSKRHDDNNVWGLFAFQGSMSVFAAVHRLDVLVWIGMLVVSLVRFVMFGQQDPLPQKRSVLKLASGIMLSTYSLIVIWAVQQQAEVRIDFWIAEASLAILVIWLVNIGKTIPKPAAMEHNHARNWKKLGLQIIGLLLFVGMPVLIPPLMTKNRIAPQLSFSGFSLASLPILSPAFWGLLIVVWVVNKFHWLENFSKYITLTWHLWLRRFQNIPDSIYKLTEIDLFQKGIQKTASLAPQISQWLYVIFEKNIFESGVQFLIDKSFAFSALLRRMHTGRLRNNLLWVAATILTALVVALIGRVG